MTTSAAVHYRIRCLDPHAHVFEVECTVAQPDPAGQRFTLPTWIPGSYLIREFARHFTKVTANADCGVVAIAKTAKDTWVAAPCAGPLTVVAEIYAYDLSVRTAYLDAGRAFFNASSLCLCPAGFEDTRCTVDLEAPVHPAGDTWRVATTLSRIDPHDTAVIGGFGRFAAANYDELIDHPVEMGTFTAASFLAAGAEHTLAISGHVDINLARITADLAAICQAQCDLFGGKAPFAHYLFLTLPLAAGHGGLEHRNSTSLITTFDALPGVHEDAMSERYAGFLGLASHEYFHSWNVKRIKPAAFVPYDLARENYTRQLWAFEGITSYYDDHMLARSGVISVERYLELVGRTMTNLLRTPARHSQSVSESSFDAWIKFYRQDENSPNAVVSYYGKGSIVALALDLTLRRHGTSLDALMQALWQRYGVTGLGVPEGGHAALASELAGSDLTDFFARHVDGVQDPPLADLLAEVGVTFKLRAMQSATDKGGTSSKAGSARRASFGATWTATGDVRLTHVFRDGAAARAGLSAHDIVIAIDGVRATAERMEQALTRTVPGEVLPVTAFRHDRLMHVDVTLDPLADDTAWLALDPAANSDVLARRQAWLFG